MNYTIGKCNVVSCTRALSTDDKKLSARPSYQTFALDYIRERAHQGRLLKIVEYVFIT